MFPKARQASSGSRRPRRKERCNVAAGQAHIKSTFNNTIVSITDPNGTATAPCSSDQVSFKGSCKSTFHATQLVAENAARIIMEHGMRKVDVSVKGLGSGCETVIHSLTVSGPEVTSISDVTLQAYNGYRPPKCRRV